MSWDTDFLDLDLREASSRAIGKKTVSWDMDFLDLELREALGEQ